MTTSLSPIILDHKDQYHPVHAGPARKQDGGQELPDWAGRCLGWQEPGGVRCRGREGQATDIPFVIPLYRVLGTRLHAPHDRFDAGGLLH